MLKLNRTFLRRTPVVLAAIAASAASRSRADSHPTGIPVLNSRPGAAYTIYLDFGGFNFDGGWGKTGYTPGNTPAYDDATTSFGSTDQTYMTQIWARVAEKYSGFNINITTVDPAVAPGQASTDALRQEYYDKQKQLMHTVIGGDGSWTSPGTAGISFIGVDSQDPYDSTQNGGVGGGYHTNFDFSEVFGTTGLPGIAGDASHENGHGLGLSHQSDYNGTTLVTEYSNSNNANGPGSVAPIMGSSERAQRGLWRNGTSDTNGALAIQNDPQVIVSNPNMNGFVNDGIGHTQAAATAMPLTGSAVNFNLAKGIIEPASTTAPVAIGASNYTTDYFSFNSIGGTVSLTVNDGGERVTPGTADAGATLFSTLSILNSSGGPLYTADTDPSSLSETITQTLPAGRYYAQVSSHGGETFVFDGSTNTFFDMGDFFLTGSGLSSTAPTAFYWTGNGSSAKWNATGPSNWQTNHSGGTDPLTGPSSTINVFFTVDSGARNLSSTLGADTTINSLNFTGTGTTAGSSGVTIAADGNTLTLAAAAAYTDSAGNTYPAGTGLVVQAGSVAQAIAVPVVLARSQTWEINNANADSLSVSGVISGTGSTLTKSGTGRLVLQAADTYTGGTVITSGTLQAVIATALGTGPVTMTGGTLQLVKIESNIPFVLGPLTITNSLAVGANDSATLQIPPTSGFTTGGVGALNLAAGSTLTLSTVGGTPGIRTVLTVKSLTDAGTLNLAGNDLDVATGTLTQVSMLTAAGYHVSGGGNWAGTGITSSAAASDPTHLTALGVVQNNQSGTPLFSSTKPFDGDSPGAGDILVKFTYFGDANLDGRVDGSDYSLIDAGYTSHGVLTGWYDGDFDYDGIVDGSDFALVDNAFNNQLAPLTSATLAATDTAQPAPSPAAVPEPAAGGLLAAVTILSGRHRRRSRVAG